MTSHISSRFAARAAVGALAALFACGGGSYQPPGDDDDGSGSDLAGSGTIHASWSILDVDGSAATCPDDFPSMRVTAIPLDGSGDQDTSADPFTGLFDCGAGAGDVVVQLAASGDGVFDLRWDEVSTDGDLTDATDVRTELGAFTAVDVSSGDASASTTFYQDGGYIWLEWNLTGASSGQTFASCADAGVDELRVTLTDDESGDPLPSFTVPCDGVTGTDGLDFENATSVGALVEPELPADYRVAIEALDASGTVIGDSSGDPEDVVVGRLNSTDSLSTSLALTIQGA